MDCPITDIVISKSRMLFGYNYIKFGDSAFLGFSSAKPSFPINQVQISTDKPCYDQQFPSGISYTDNSIYQVFENEFILRPEQNTSAEFYQNELIKETRETMYTKRKWVGQGI